MYKITSYLKTYSLLNVSANNCHPEGDNNTQKLYKCNNKSKFISIMLKIITTGVDIIV
jgi:hypothetical protein